MNENEKFFCHQAAAKGFRAITKAYCRDKCDSPQRGAKAECPDSVRPQLSEEIQGRRTTEELRTELQEELNKAKSRLANARGEELSGLLEQIEGIERTLKNIQPKPTVPGDGTTGESSKKMRRGGRP